MSCKICKNTTANYCPNCFDGNVPIKQPIVEKSDIMRCSSCGCIKNPTSIMQGRDGSCQCLCHNEFGCGSGSHLLVAKENNRNYIGIELDENYYKIAEERLANN